MTNSSSNIDQSSRTFKRVISGTDSQSYESLGTKVPPHANDAEVAVLGAIMLEKSAISKVIEILEPDSFYNEAHRKIYETMLKMSEVGKTIDIVSLADELNKRGIIEMIGGTYYLAELNSLTPTAANVEQHARIIQEKFLKRCLIATAGTILENAYDETSDALEDVDRAETEVFKIAEKRFIRSFIDINTLAHQTIDLINKLAERDKNSMTGVPSGFTDLDEKLGGFQNSDLIIIAARPSMGKTALALSIARNVAVEYDMPVAFFSIEMSDIQLMIRLISAESRINAHKIRTGYITHDDINKIINKIDKLVYSKMFIDDSPSLSLAELRAKCRRLKAEHGVKLVIVDYLQLLHPPKAESREREISIISRSLKQMAKELDIPVIALAQLNRGIETRTDKRPVLSDLRESGSIEQDADVVMFINRPEFYGIKVYPDTQTPTENTAEIIIGKQRNGPTGIAKLGYLKDFARFENLALRNDEPQMEADEYNDDAPF